MKRILLWNSNSKRDLLGIKLLELVLQRKGFKTMVCNDDQMKLKLSTFQPHGLIAARGNFDAARKSAVACKVFIVPGEGAQLTKETMLSVFMGRSYFKLDSVDWIERCYLWGAPTRGWLLETGLFKEKQLKIVGNPRIDLYRDKDLVARLKNRKPKQFVLGVAISAKSTSAANAHSPGYAESYFNMHPEMNFPIVPKGRHYEDICWRDQAVLRLTMRYMRTFLQQMEGSIIFRPSPFEDPREYKFLEKCYKGRVRVMDEQTIPEFLCGIDTLLTCSSTTGIEALLLGIPVISIMGTMDQEHLFQHVATQPSGFETYVPFYHLPKTEEQLLNLLKMAKEGNLPVSPKTTQEVNQLLQDIYTWPSKRSACEEIADDVTNTLRDVPQASSDVWDKAVKHKYPLPRFLLAPAYTLRHWVDYWQSGFFRGYYRFRKNKVKNVEKLAREVDFRKGINHAETGI